jgi:hypothetical protein
MLSYPRNFVASGWLLDSLACVPSSMSLPPCIALCGARRPSASRRLPIDLPRYLTSWLPAPPSRNSSDMLVLCSTVQTRRIRLPHLWAAGWLACRPLFVACVHDRLTTSPASRLSPALPPWLIRARRRHPPPGSSCLCVRSRSCAAKLGARFADRAPPASRGSVRRWFGFLVRRGRLPWPLTCLLRGARSASRSSSSGSRPLFALTMIARLGFTI